MSYYWLSEHQQLIEEYYWVQFSGATSGKTRSDIVKWYDNYKKLTQIK
jgi:hypothetical protein